MNLIPGATYQNRSLVIFIVTFYIYTSFACSSLIIHCLHNRSMSGFKDSPYCSCEDERPAFLIQNCSKDMI